MRVIKRIATTGRSVVCTIHQPVRCLRILDAHCCCFQSAELFFMFDRLLLLEAGGYQAYFGGLLTLSLLSVH